MLRTLSEHFENAVIETLGFDIETAFDPAELAGPVKEVYIDPKGNVARRYTYPAMCPEDTDQVKLFVNSVQVDTLPDVVLNSFVPDPNPVRNEALAYPLIKGDPNLKLMFGFNTVGQTLDITVAIPGVSEERVKVSFAADYLNIHIDEDPAAIPNTRYLFIEFNDTRQPMYRSIYIDTTKFSIEKLKYRVQDGMLEIGIPRKQVIENCLVFKPTKKNPTSKTTKRKLEEANTENPISRSELFS